MTSKVPLNELHQSTDDILGSSKGFDFVLNDDLEAAQDIFSSRDSVFHLLGTGVVRFLQAALGMERELMPEATLRLGQAEAAAKKASKQLKLSSDASKHRFVPGTEFEIVQADAIVLLGMTQALSESYVGYLQCMVALNSAHGKFSKIYKSVYPNGLDSYSTPAATPRQSSTNIPKLLHSTSSASLRSTSSPTPSFLGRWTGSSSLKSPGSLTPPIVPQSPVEELILSGAAFGFGLFNLVFSLLPVGVKRLVGFLGFQSDRRLALRALAVAAKGNDIHSHFAALVLMTFHGLVLLLTGYQADEEHIVKQYRAILDKVQLQFPHGSLWLLNRAKLARYTSNPSEAISILQEALSSPDRHFVQANSLLVFELAWILFSERRYEESAQTFMRMRALNSWSHATYTFIAAGCYVSLNQLDKAQEILDSIPELLDKRKMGGKDLPTEVFIRTKMEFYKKKQRQRGGLEKDYVECIRISPAEEVAIFWNTHSRIPQTTAEAHIYELLKFTPSVSTFTPYNKLSPASTIVNSSASSAASSTATSLDLDTPDEVVVRNFLLGILHRSAGQYAISREFLTPISKKTVPALEATWVVPLASFELAVLALKEAEDEVKKSATDTKEVGDAQRLSQLAMWKTVLQNATDHLELAVANSNNTLMNSRLDSRIALLRDEIETKKLMVGL